jgi:NAD(P)-dependent dehydrogenase (short-subunit alcohol dehydrogenase family)
MDLHGKTCLVTGATSGIGEAIALGLAGRGASVVALARDEARGRDTLEKMRRAGAVEPELLVADLSEGDSLVRAARSFTSRHRELNLLVHSAAVFLFHRSTSPEGLELMFATNHLGPFRLTHLLLDALKAGAPARVLTITAPSTVRLDFDDLQGEKRFRATNAFGATKAANLLFAFALARRLEGTGVTSSAIHPGLVRSKLMRHAPAPLRWLSYLTSAPPQRAVEPILDVAADPAYAGRTGRFYLRGKEIDPPAYTREQATQDRLWAISEQLAGLHPGG